MHVSPDTLRLQIDYTIWASRRILDAAAALSHDELTRDFASADKTILGTLQHIFGADLNWMERMEGRSLKAFPYDANASLAWLEEQWPKVWRRWQAYASGLDEAAVEAPVSYLDFKGHPWSTPVWQVMLHVVNHATHHRGQAAGFIRALGKTPPPLDLMAYYRELSS